MPKTVMPVCDISLQTLNLFILHKLFLLPESAATDVMQVSERLLGLHAKRPQTPYLMLQARLPNFTAEQLDDLLYQQRVLLRAHAMRGTVHMLPLAQYRIILAATAGQLDGMYQRAFKHLDNKQAIIEAILETIRQQGALLIEEIKAALSLDVDNRDLYRLVNYLCTSGVLVKSTVKGTWRNSVYRYQLLADWQPDIPNSNLDGPAAQAKLIEWYLAAYGPATLDDIVWWTGLTKTKVNKGLKSLSQTTVSTYFEALADEAFLLQDDYKVLSTWQPPDAPQITFLPSFDAYVIAYIKRERLIDEGNYGRIFRGVAGIIEPVVLLNGRIIGTWKYAIDEDGVATELFEQPQGIQDALQTASYKTAHFLELADANTK